MNQIKEVARDIFMVTRFLGRGRAGSSVNTYVLAGKEGLVFDPGYGSWQRPHPLVRAIRDLQDPGAGPLNLTRAMTSHSHWDHFSGLSPLQNQLGLEVLATQKQARVITSRQAFKQSFSPRPGTGGSGFQRVKAVLAGEAFMTLARVCLVKGPVTVIPERCRLTVGTRTWQVLPAPGHCDDDLVLYCPEQGILLGGDLVLRRINTWLGPPRSDLKTYVQSLEMLGALPGLRLILPAHGSPVKDPVSRIEAIISRRRQKARELLELLAASKESLSPDQLLDRILPRAGQVQRYLSRGMLEATLDYLVKEGLAEALLSGDKVRYRAM